MDGLSMSQEQTKFITETVAKERGKLFSFIRKRVKGKEDAEDILQDVFVQLVNVYESIGSIDKVASWLYKVANNKIIDASRKKRPSLYENMNSTLDEEESINFQDLLPDLSNSPEDMLLQELIWEMVQEALKELPEEQRQVFVWHEFEEMSFKQIAEKTGLSENTLFSRKRYAIVYLRERLKTLYKEL